MSRRRRRQVLRKKSIAPTIQASMEQLEVSETQTDLRSSIRKKIENYCPGSCVRIPCSSAEENRVPRVCKRAWKACLRPFVAISTFVVTTVLFIFGVYLKTDVVCFERLGCFSVAGPWAERPALFNFAPQSPTVINTTFIVTSRLDPDGQYGMIHPVKFSHFGVVNEVQIPWRNSSQVVFLIHGYTDMSGTWMQTLKQAFLAQNDDIIVILVDWRSGASGVYPQVVSNTRVVAREITLFVRFIQRRFGRITPKRIHLVGHSLGSQISSYVGKALANSTFNIHQITALDPAFPLFEGYNSEIRLHKSDALFVLAIHSNVGPWGLGMKEPVGTVDIYLNDGRDQRGCVRMGSIFKDADMKHETDQMKSNDSLPRIVGAFSNLKDKLACSHRRAYMWLEDVLRDMAGILFVNYTHAYTPVVAYPISWTNGTDILKLTMERAVKYSFCQNDTVQNCWKLERNKKDAFFQLPPVIQGRNKSTSFFIPTSDYSPFCVRMALLKIFTCPPTSNNAPPSLQDWGSPKAGSDMENWELTISQAIFEDEVSIYKGTLYDKLQIQAWVEFPCDELQQPVQLRQGRDGKFINYLSVKLAASLQETSSRETDEPKKTEEKAPPGLCASKMRLTYYNETEHEIIRLSSTEQQQNGSSLLIKSNECVEIKFSL